MEKSRLLCVNKLVTNQVNLFFECSLINYAFNVDHVFKSF